EGDEAGQRLRGEQLERFDANDMEELRNAQSGGWNAYQQTKDNLVARGVPAAEIRFIQEASTDAQKQAIFDAVNDGTIRVLIGSTPRMGAGTNVQKRLVAIHHADVTWKPSDIEQREGRGIRQGNELLKKYGIDRFEIEILAYATERTIDAKMWSLNASKLKTINAIRKYDGAFSMDFEDEDSVSMAELAALASGDPMLLERVKLMSEIDKLELLKRQHARKEWGITGQIEDAEATIARNPDRKRAAEVDLASIQAGIADVEQDAATRSVNVEGEHFSDGSLARGAVMAAVKAQQGGDDKKKMSIKVGGRRLSSLEGAMGAVGSAIGDQQTFLMQVDGKKLIARTDAARAIAELASDASAGLAAGEAKTIDIGQYLGLQLQATMESGREGFWTSLAVLRADGSTLATGDTKLRDNAEYTTSAMRTAVEDLEKALAPAGLEYAIANYQRRYDAAVAALPELRARKGGPFAQQDELDAKNARLEVVIRELSNGGPSAARNVVERTNPLRRPDGSFRRQAPDKLMFSRTRIDTDAPLVNIFSQIATDDAAFRMPDSNAKTLAGILADMAPTLSVDEFVGEGDLEDAAAPVDRAWHITSPSGEQASVYRNNRNKEIWLDISNWKEGRTGSGVYQAVATLAHNTGHVFIGDPAGLSDKALYRRTEHMISSALRHGTTKHLAPHARQVEATGTAGGADVRPIDWQVGDDAHNLQEMLVSSYTNILHLFPEIADVTYNFARARFERAPVRASAGALRADQSDLGEWSDEQGLGPAYGGSTSGRGTDRADEGARDIGRVDAVPFTNEDFVTAAESVRNAYDVFFPTARGMYTPPIGMSDIKRAVLTQSVLQEAGRDGGREVLDHVSERLLQRVSPQLARLLYSRDAEYFRADGVSSLPTLPAGADAGTTAPLELSGVDFLRAMKATEQLNRELAKADMAPVRALRIAPNAQFALARQVGKALGIEVNFVSKNAEFEGVAYNGVAYLTEGMRNAELAIAGHETLHALEQSNPALGAKLRTQIRAYLKEGVVEDRQAREFAANGFQDVTEDQAEAEVIADINGGMWMDPVFWSDLAKADRALFRRVAYKFMEVAAKLIKSLRGSRFDVTALVRDVDAVRAIMVATWAENNATRDAAAPAPVVRRAMRETSVALPRAKWLSDEVIAKEVENRIGKFEHQPVVRIRDSAFGVLPGVASDEHVSGAVYKGVIYLFRDALPTLREVQRTLFHEMLHYGLQRFLPGDEYITRMNMIYQRDGAFRAEADRWVKTGQGQLALKHGGQKYATARGIDEALAVLAEPNAGAFTRTDVRAKVERTVQRWLASLAEWLGMPEAAAYWRGMKNEEARALIQQIFRKTATDFPPADPWAAAGSAALRKGKPASSGAVAPGSSPAFSRVGLGSALASAANSIAEVRLPANYLIGDLFNSTGKLSWWHKSIGTMDNLAKRQPAFAAVYGAVQRFLGDVSRYAVVAADLAPTLLPKLENIADIVGKNRKKALRAADTKAIGAPIFEGTLTWARDAHGKPVKIEDLEEQAEAMSTAEKARILLEKGIIDDQQNRAWQHNPLDIYDSIINSRFKDTQLRAGVVWSDTELRSMFSLSADQVALYRQFRAALDKSLTNLTISEMVKMGGKDAKGMLEQAVAAPDLPAAAALLRDHFIALAKLDPEKMDIHLDTARQIMNLSDKGKDLMDRGYAPLSRFGKHTVYVQEGEDQVYFGMFETQYEASKMARDMRAEHPGAQVSHGTVSADAYKLFAGVSPETIELFGSMVGLDSQASAASTEVYQTYLKLAKNNRSSMKRMIQRKGIAGFSEDAGRVLAGFIYSNARLTAGNAHLGEIDEAITEIPKQQGELTDAAMQLREHIRNPEAGAPLGGLMFAQFLGGSVASAMVNLTQPFTMTLPYLSQFGGLTKAGARLAAAVKDAGKDATGDAQLDAAMQWAIEEGIVAPQEVHYLQTQASGKGALRAGDGTKAGNTRAHLNNAMAKVTLGWGKLFAMAELANRRITFIAAYRTAVDEGFPDPAKFAQEAVAQTQGIYNSGNKPKWARGAVGSLLMTFKQYSIGYLELLSRMAFAGAPGSKERAAGRRAALYMLAVLLLMGGADGLPFEQDLEDAVDGILQRLGYNFSSKRSKQAFLTNTLGQGGADFVLKGVSSMPGMPVDVAGRFGMGNLIPGTGLLTKKDSYTRDLGELAGPAGDVAKRAFTGAGKLLGGDVAGAVLDVTPAAVRNVSKGTDMLATGAYRDARGYNVNDTSPAEAMMKMVGFQPNSTADIQDAKGQALNMVGQNRMRSMEIAEHWAQGLADRDMAKVDEARARRDDWNAKNPATPIRVSMPGVIKRVQAMRQDALNRTQKTAPAALKQTVQRELAETRAE
ncbi:PLxRFG domain-containing protein, partial [Massilia sp. CCM 8734]|nr:PLxRFG domain-containing protein [Massilia sp. CCM 8734]